MHMLPSEIYFIFWKKRKKIKGKFKKAKKTTTKTPKELRELEKGQN